MLKDVLPVYLQDESLTLLYSLLHDGSDMTSFFSRTRGYRYTVILVHAASGEMFGGFAAAGGGWKQSSKYYGEGESFVFQFGKNSLPYHTRYLDCTRKYIQADS